MCIIVVKPAEREWSPDLVRNMIVCSNYDGFGMMWVEEGRVKRLVSMGTTDEKIDLYKEHMNKGDLAIHVRHATMGERNEDNCHPYRILSKDEGDKIDAYVMHNGTINNVQVDKQFSDSWNFANYFLRPFLQGRNEVITDKNFLYLITGMIGDGNKLVILDSKSRWHIVNSLAGSYQQGCWVSTKTEQRPLVRTQFTSSAKNTPTPRSQNSMHSTVAKHPIRQGDWATDSDGRSHFVVNPNAHRGSGGSEDSSGSNDDAEGHTQRMEEEGTGPVVVRNASEKETKGQSLRQGQVLLPLLGAGDGHIASRTVEASIVKSTANGAWEPPKVLDPRNTSPWGQITYDPKEIATLSKEEIIQLVLSAPLEITDYIWDATHEIVSLRKPT